MTSELTQIKGCVHPHRCLQKMSLSMLNQVESRHVFGDLAVWMSYTGDHMANCAKPVRWKGQNVFSLNALITVLKSPPEVCYFKCQVWLILHLSLLNNFIFFPLIQPLPAPSIPPKKLPMPQEDYSLLWNCYQQQASVVNVNVNKLGYLYFSLILKQCILPALRIQGINPNLILTAVFFKK